MSHWHDAVEDDDDSETNLQGPMKGNRNEGRRRYPPTSTDRYGLASSIEVYSDDDDLDVEELPEGVVVGQNVPTSWVNLPPRRTVLNSIEETEEIAVIDLRNAFDEAAVRNQIAGGGVDKTELARALRFTAGAPLLADDIMALTGPSVSWNTLLAMARPYVQLDSLSKPPLRRSIEDDNDSLNDANVSHRSPLYSREIDIRTHSNRSRTGAGDDRLAESTEKSPIPNRISALSARLGSNYDDDTDSRADSDIRSSSASAQLFEKFFPDRVRKKKNGGRFSSDDDDDDDQEDDESEANIRRQIRSKLGSSVEKSSDYEAARMDKNRQQSVWGDRTGKLGVTKSMEGEQWLDPEVESARKAREDTHRESAAGDFRSFPSMESDNGIGDATEQTDASASLTATATARPRKQDRSDRVRWSTDLEDVIGHDDLTPEAPIRQSEPHPENELESGSNHSFQGTGDGARDTSRDENVHLSDISNNEAPGGDEPINNRDNNDDYEDRRQNESESSAASRLQVQTSSDVVLSPKKSDSKSPKPLPASKSPARSPLKGAVKSPSKSPKKSALKTAKSLNGPNNAPSQLDSSVGTSLGRPPRPRQPSQYSAASSSMTSNPSVVSLPARSPSPDRSPPSSSSAVAVLESAAGAGAGSRGRGTIRGNDFHLRTSASPSDGDGDDPDDDPDEVDSQSSNHPDFDGLVRLKPLSDYARKTGVIIEGFLKKKSDRTGFWQQRYFVLSESSTEFCMLRIYYGAKESSWGMVPLKLKAALPASAIISVAAKQTRMKKGKNFSISFSRYKTQKGPSFSHNSPQSGYASANSSDAGDGDECDKVMKLKAPDVNTRIVWVTILERMLSLFVHGIQT